MMLGGQIPDYEVVLHHCCITTRGSSPPRFLPPPSSEMDPQADDQQKLAKIIESETQIVDSPDALVLSSDPNHVRPRPHVHTRGQ